MEFLRQQQFPTIDCPSFPLHLNPVEHPWDQWKKKVTKTDPRPRSRQTLIRAIQEEWGRFPLQRVQKFIRSMNRPVELCLKEDGGHIRY